MKKDSEDQDEEIDLQKVLAETKPNLEIAEAGEESHAKPKKKPAKKKVTKKEEKTEVATEAKTEAATEDKGE